MEEMAWRLLIRKSLALLVMLFGPSWSYHKRSA
jgi:hypothetical protein